MEHNANINQSIPKGWKIEQLSTICETKLGGTPNTNTEDYWNGSIPWLNSGEVATSPILKSEKTITELGMQKSTTSFAKAGAILMSITRYIRPSILGMDSCFNQSIVAVIPNEKYHTAFLYPFMHSQVDRYMVLRTGAQQPHINKQIVDETLVVCPPIHILKNFYEMVEPLIALQISIMKETHKLIDIRSFLLPSLLTGQATLGK